MLDPHATPAAMSEPRGNGETARKRFLDTAAELFARKGYHATTIRDIARAIGVTPGAIYAHFSAKSQLLLAVYEAGVTHMSRGLEDGAAGDDPWERLEGACRRHLEALYEAGGYGRVVIRVLPADEPDVADDLAHLRENYESRFRRMVDDLELRPGTDRGLFRLSLLGALNWTLVWYRPGSHSPRAIARQLVHDLRHGAGRG